MDLSVLLSAVIAGASAYGPHAAKVIGEIAGTEVVKEVTKEAYKSLKTTLASVCGRAAGWAAEKVEVDPSSEEAQRELGAQIGSIQDEDAAEVTEKLDALIAALADDKAARQVADKAARIKIDVDAAGHVKIDNVKGATTFDVKAKAGRDFEFRNVEMGGGKSSGN